MPYLYQFGHYHPGLFTLECSRSGAGALAALANLKLLGKQGYRVMLGHSVEMAELLRERLEALPCVNFRRNSARDFRHNGATEKYRN